LRRRQVRKRGMHAVLELRVFADAVGYGGKAHSVDERLRRARSDAFAAAAGFGAGNDHGLAQRRAHRPPPAARVSRPRSGKFGLLAGWGTSSRPIGIMPLSSAPMSGAPSR